LHYSSYLGVVLEILFRGHRRLSQTL